MQINISKNKFSFNYLISLNLDCVLIHIRAFLQVKPVQAAEPFQSLNYHCIGAKATKKKKWNKNVKQRIPKITQNWWSKNERNKQNKYAETKSAFEDAGMHSFIYVAYIAQSLINVERKCEREREQIPIHFLSHILGRKASFST